MDLDTQIREFVRERDEVLCSFDRDRIISFYRKHGEELPSHPLIFWASICKAICGIRNVPLPALQKARLWLQIHGMSETCGYPDPELNGAWQ